MSRLGGGGACRRVPGCECAGEGGRYCLVSWESDKIFWGEGGSGAGRGAAAGGRGKTDQLRERLGLGGRWSGRPVQYLAVFLWIR